MFCLFWICGDSREERHADLFLSEFHKWALSVAYFVVKGGGKFEVVGGRVEDKWGLMGPWKSGRFDFWIVPLRSQWVGQIWQTATNPPTTSLSPRSSIRPQTASVSFAVCLSPLCLSLLNIYNKWVTDMVLTEKRFTTLTSLTSLLTPRCTRKMVVCVCEKHSFIPTLLKTGKANVLLLFCSEVHHLFIQIVLV